MLFYIHINFFCDLFNVDSKIICQELFPWNLCNYSQSCIPFNEFPTCYWVLLSTQSTHKGFLRVFFFHFSPLLGKAFQKWLIILNLLWGHKKAFESDSRWPQIFWHSCHWEVGSASLTLESKQGSVTFLTNKKEQMWCSGTLRAKA